MKFRCRRARAGEALGAPRARVARPAAAEALTRAARLSHRAGQEVQVLLPPEAGGGFVLVKIPQARARIASRIARAAAR